MPKTDDLIGKPFEYGGRGPEVYDCYGLLMELYRRDGIALPDYRSPTDGLLISQLFAMESVRLWEQVQCQPGAAVLIRIPGNMHVGYVLDEFRFIHTWEGCHGVLIEKLADWERRFVGFYRYVG